MSLEVLMARSRLISFRADEEVNELLDQLVLVKATDRSKTWHIKEALRKYLDLHAWQVEEIRKALEDVESGRLIDNDDVYQWINSWGEDNEGEAPA